MNSTPRIAAERVRTPQSTLLAGLALITGSVVLLWFAPDSYTIYKALHVIAIVVWVLSLIHI